MCGSSGDSSGGALQSTIIRRATYQSSRYLDLVPFTQLAPEEQDQLAELRNDERVAAFLKPRPGRHGRLHAVDHDTASLFQTLKTPATPPEELAVDDRTMARLVLDGIIGIGIGDAFISGPAATNLLFGSLPASNTTGRLAQLTESALEYGASLHIDNALALAGRLYRYNVEPLSPYWRRRLPDDEAIDAFLEMDRFGATAQLVHDSGGSAATDRPFWRHWRTPETQGVRTDQPTYKLYVSPRIELLPHCLATVTSLLTAPHRPFAFKIGRKLHGLLRPDKLVMYFVSPENLDRAAVDLATRLDGVPAQGVPFTAKIMADGLLSWGMDPPANESLVEWHYDASWRRWLVNRLAVALVVAQDCPSDVSPVTFAKARVWLDGVDPDRWTPAETLWTTPSTAGDV